MPQPVVEESSERSTLPLSKLARHLVIPDGIVDTLWWEVEERCYQFGDSFDTWQDGLGQLALGLRADGLFACSVGGITLSIPRQVAKTFITMRIVVALCTLFPNLLVIWTAHHGSTSDKTFKNLVSMVSRKSMKRWVNERDISHGNGDQAIKFRNGSEIKIGARGHGFGRGFDQVDIAVFDEAQILSSAGLDDIVPGTNQSKLKHGALLFFMGTPPRPKDPGEEFTLRRRKALKDKPEGEVVATKGEGLYVEFSADEATGKPGGPALADKHQILRANPSVPHRTPWVSIWRMRENLGNDDSWRREALGIWDGDGVPQWQVITKARWDMLETKTAPALDDAIIAYGVKFSPDGERVALAEAIKTDDGIFVEAIGIAPFAQGIRVFLEYLTEPTRAGRHIYIDGAAGSAMMETELLRARIRPRFVTVANTGQAIHANAGFKQACEDRNLTHSGQVELTEAVRYAETREINKNGGWGWRPTSPDFDITPLEAACLAHYATSGGKKRDYSRKAVF